jgi:hypothetical protein
MIYASCCFAFLRSLHALLYLPYQPLYIAGLGPGLVRIDCLGKSQPFSQAAVTLR